MSFLGKIKGHVYKGLLNICDSTNNVEMYIKIMFFHRLGYWPNLKNPRSFNEKLQWLKLYDHNPKYTLYADKYRVREHIADVLGEEYLIPLIGVYSNPDEIDFDKLPDKFVLKCNHGASYNIICTNKELLDVEKTRLQLSNWLSHDYYNEKKEFHYKDIPKRILCEQFMKDTHSNELNDYKLFCIGGKVRMIQVDFDRYTNHKRNIYDTKWNILDVEISFPRDPNRHKTPPQSLQEMIYYAEKLGAEFPQVRVDFYIINGKVYFGEMTFFSGAGFSKYIPSSFERNLGDYLVLPDVGK